MEKILYDLMDWAGIEELVYSEASDPGRLLGEHVIKEGLLIQAFLPNAAKVSVKIGEESFPMEMADENGFFAVLLEDRLELVPYHFLVTYEDGDSEEIVDPYSYQFYTAFTEEEVKKFGAGIYYDSYQKFGAHPTVEAGISGVHFAVWAPDAMRVSVVGDFNFWDGRRHQMKKRGPSGIYEIFIPGLKPGTIYKYEIKTKAGDPMLKADPYANFSELRPNTASVIWDMTDYQWNDGEWIEKRKAAKDRLKDSPMSIYEVHLGSWMQKPVAQDENGDDINGSQFYNYREIAEKLAAYVKEMGYTHVELLPVMEHPLDESWGYQVTGYYAPTSRFGTPDDFKAFMDYMHKEGIGVILDWVPAHFPRDAHGLAAFDGTCLYEHKDPRQGSHPHWGTLIYNYGRPQVSNFLISNALYWAKEFHADGIRMDAVASMLYLDYGKNAGEWIANMYGGNENLEAVEFLKHLNSIFARDTEGAVLIAEESTAWPKVSGDENDGGLGFDFKWNMGWMNDFLDYMQCDPYFRHDHYGELTFSMLYAYSEKFVLVFSHDEVVHGKGSMAGKMPGDTQEKKFANLRTAYGFMMGHPGKKLLFMGQDFGQMDEWNEKESLEWGLLKYDIHSQMKDYVKALNHLYRTQPALYKMDYEPEGFEWINCTYNDENIVIFERKTDKSEETLLFVCNFVPVEHEKFRLGVPFAGKYKEILNSDAKQFGGSGMVNPRVKMSKKEEWDARENSIVINLAPMSVAVFSCTPYEEEPVTGKKKPAEKKKRPAKQPSVKIPASPLDVISEKVGQIIKTARESQTGKRNKG
ncbi:1,4-alpha-glucan branching protein GlgB [Clostridium sp. AF37-5AT]|nr:MULTISPECIES: 1,4-alpha-glucan branching protein GlgB [unclassified Clostridium]RHN99483.1 1,4-alpha-glucan branching protein GlgB [Clostridium sp. AM22-16AC]RHO94834.1 1,4-alpha-glucan branching protein GlgB [Clostridium sp. AF37-5AT]